MITDIKCNVLLGMFEFASKYNCESLKRKSASVIQHRFISVSKLNDLVALPAELLGEIFSWDSLILGTIVY